MFTKATRVILALALVVAATLLLVGGMATASTDLEPEQAPVRRGKWIEVILSQQRLVAWEDGRMVMSTSVSTGTRRTPTVRGTFRIYRKYAKQRMVGRDYDLPNVPYVMYFTGAYAMHGTYWHSNFGQPMSHGCINLPTGKAAWLYQWAPHGTAVVVH
jgi:lipoprotein-anchoring transpeptidase ErfK/SrfK